MRAALDKTLGFMRLKAFQNRLRLAGMPVGSVISCKDNPLDLRPAVDGLMARIEQVSASLTDPNQPIILLMGEEHSTVSHNALQQMVMRRLIADQWRVAHGDESPYNMLGEILKENLRYDDLTPDQMANIMCNDPDGKWLLPVLLANNVSGYAPVIKSGCLDFYLQNKILSCFTDLARKHGIFLSPDDPFTNSIVAKHAPHLIGKKIHIESVNGVRLRNIGTLKQVFRHIEHLQARAVHHNGRLIYCLQVGADHLVGDQAKGFLYKDSLVAQFVQAGAAVIPVYMTRSDMGLDEFPTEGYAALQEYGLVIGGMDEKEFKFGDIGEADWIKGLAKASKAELSAFEIQVNGELSQKALAYQIYIDTNASQLKAELGIAL